MSTVISYAKSDKAYKVRCIVRGMPQPETIGDYIRRVMNEENLTFRNIESLSKGAISAGYVNDLVKGKTKNPSVAKLKALARGLGRTETEVIAIARGEAPERGSDFLKSRLGIVSLRMTQLPKMTDIDEAKADILIESLERFIDDLESN